MDPNEPVTSNAASSPLGEPVDVVLNRMNIGVDADLVPGELGKSESEDFEVREREEEPSTDGLCKEKRYWMLLDLLGQSQSYSRYLREKMGQANESATLGMNTERKKLKESIGKRKLEDNAPSSSSSQSKKLKFDVVWEVGDEKISDKQPLLLTGGVMRDYQIAGFQWIVTLFENDFNGILADEMGLGKTIQTIALLCHLVEMEIPGPFLIVAPKNTLNNWIHEFKKFAPVFPTVLYHGDKTERQKLRRTKLRESFLIENINKRVKNAFVTSHEIALNDKAFLCGVNWRYMVVDEAHCLKNVKCKLIGKLKKYKALNKLLLTGTPLQNNLSELWSLLNFIMPGTFHDLRVFESWFDPKKIDVNKEESKRILNQEKHNNVITILHRILTPFILRRVKADVDLAIPPKKEILVYCPMSLRQREFYEATVNITLKDLAKIQNKETKFDDVNVKRGRGMRKRNLVNYSKFFSGGLQRPMRKTNPVDYLRLFREDSHRSLTANHDNLKASSDNHQEKQNKLTDVVNTSRLTKELNLSSRNRMMDLRKITNHPYLMEHPLSEDGLHFQVNKEIIDISGKMKILDQMLDELTKRNHKVLIFSQMTRMLDILEDYLNLKETNYSRLDGEVKYKDRQKNIDEFNENPNVKVFLLSTRAGGLGINLVAADTCIIYDSDWNPQQDLQAQDRCHRIGQNKPVVVFRLVTCNTIDQRIVERAAAKRKLEKIIIHSKKFKSNYSAGLKETLEKISPQELLNLLHSNDHEYVVYWNEGSILTKTELNALLDRSDMLEDKIPNMKRKDMDSFFKVIDAYSENKNDLVSEP